jgi:hypothetical protein
MVHGDRGLLAVQVEHLDFPVHAGHSHPVAVGGEVFGVN